MPQKHIPLPSALRNRNRLTNKSRIKIVYGSLDDDIIEPYNPDLAAATAGIDQEDAQVCFFARRWPSFRCKNGLFVVALRGIFSLARGPRSKSADC